MAINSAEKSVEAGGSIGAMLDRQAKARNPNAPRTHSPREPVASRPRHVAILCKERRAPISMTDLRYSNADLSAALAVSGGLTVERGESCLSDLYVVLRSIEACADAAELSTTIGRPPCISI